MPSRAVLPDVWHAEKAPREVEGPSQCVMFHKMFRKSTTMDSDGTPCAAVSGSWRRPSAAVACTAKDSSNVLSAFRIGTYLACPLHRLLHTGERSKMAFVEWSSNLSVCVKGIGLQHTGLVETINSLNAVTLSKRAREQRAAIYQLLRWEIGPIESKSTEGWKLCSLAVGKTMATA
jgi:hypothetical protein